MKSGTYVSEAPEVLTKRKATTKGTGWPIARPIGLLVTAVEAVRVIYLKNAETLGNQMLEGLQLEPPFHKSFLK